MCRALHFCSDRQNTHTIHDLNCMLWYTPATHHYAIDREGTEFYPQERRSYARMARAMRRAAAGDAARNRRRESGSPASSNAERPARSHEANRAPAARHASVSARDTDALLVTSSPQTLLFTPSSSGPSHPALAMPHAPHHRRA